MYPRLLNPPKGSFFLFGPRGTGKSSWVRMLPQAIYLDLLESELFLSLMANPSRLEHHIPKSHRGWVIIDEVQKLPALLDEVHRLIESRKIRFALTGSSARKLRRGGVNLLGGRAIMLSLHPLTAQELGTDFNLRHSLSVGNLPTVQVERDPMQARAYLSAYVEGYLKEEIHAEGLTRNLAAFARFLEAINFSQAAPLNISAVARDCQVERKTIENYIEILEDLLLGVRLPVFTRRARRELSRHPKFFLFDVGVFRTLRPKGPLDIAEEIGGAALETLVFQELRALNDAMSFDYAIHTWRTRAGVEVDFVLYGPRGLIAIEVKSGDRLRGGEARGLEAFLDDYPKAHAYLVYAGRRREEQGNVSVVPVAEFLSDLPRILEGEVGHSDASTTAL